MPPYQRLHPLSILLDLVRWLAQSIIGLIALYFAMFRDQPLLALLLFGATLTLLLATSWLRWTRFRWYLSDQDVRIHSGIISRNNRSLPLERIQDVQLARKPLHRLLGLASVQFETGGSGGEADTLDALMLADAQALRDAVRRAKRGAPLAVAGTSAAAAGPVAIGQSGDLDDRDDTDEAAPLFAMDARRLLIAGLFNFSFIIFAGVSAAAQNFGWQIEVEDLRLRALLDALDNFDLLRGWSFATQIIGVVGALAALLLTGAISGMGLMVLRNYRFRLDRVARGFRRRRGLLTLTDMVMPLHRVQAAIIQTGPVRRTFGWYALSLQSLAHDGENSSDHDAAPFARRAEIVPILRECRLADAPDHRVFTSVDPAMWWRNTALLTLLLGGIAIANALIVHPLLIALLLLALPLGGAQWLDWRCHRYWLSGGQLYVHRGWWRQRLTIIAIKNLQSADIAQSPLDHPLGLARLTLGVAGGSPLRPLTIHALPVAQAQALRTALLGGGAMCR